METVSGWGESISNKATASDHQELVRVMAGLLMAFLKTSPKFSMGRGVRHRDSSSLILYELIVHIYYIYIYMYMGLRWNHSILYLCYYIQLWISPGYDAHQEGSRGSNNLPLLKILSTGLVDK